VLGRLLRISARLARWLFLLAIFVISAYLAFSAWIRRGTTAVPPLAGQTEAAAKETLARRGLAFRVAEVGRWSAAVPAGSVLETRPAAGSSVKQGAEIELVLSRGPQRISVPDLTGKAVSAARLTLEGEGLATGATLAVYSGRGAAGTVVGQDPAPGAEVGGGTAVALLVALEGAPPAWVMPDLVSRRYEPVRAALEGSGFRFASVTYEPYEGVPAGTILRQAPLAGHPLHRSDAIALVVAGATGATP
jgi:serine/threonine-protein kinase